MPVTCSTFLVIPSGSRIKLVASWTTSAGEKPQSSARFEFAENNALYFLPGDKESKSIETPIRMNDDRSWSAEVECGYVNHAAIGRSARFITVQSSWVRRSGKPYPQVSRRASAILS